MSTSTSRVAPPSIPSEPRYEKKFVSVLGKQMAYVEHVPSNRNSDTEDIIVFVHGNPTSSYMWRNVMPHCEEMKGRDGEGVRLIAPDLIGMGSSEKLSNTDDPSRYSLREQSRYFSAFLEALGVHKRVTFVAHSWGGTLVAHWGSQQSQKGNVDAVRALVIIEVVYKPFGSWEDVPKKIRGGVKIDAETSYKVVFWMLLPVRPRCLFDNEEKFDARIHARARKSQRLWGSGDEVLSSGFRKSHIPME